MGDAVIEAEATRVPKTARNDDTRGRQRLKVITAVGLVILVGFAGVVAWQQWPTGEQAGPERAMKPLDTFTDCGECPEIVMIPSGTRGQRRSRANLFQKQGWRFCITPLLRAALDCSDRLQVRLSRNNAINRHRPLENPAALHVTTLETKDLITLAITSAAFLVAFVSLAWQVVSYFRTSHATHFDKLMEIWNQIVDRYIANPEFLDRSYTEAYSDDADHVRRLRYDALCYKLWFFVDNIIDKGLQKENLFQNIILHFVSYHKNWLQKNPFNFQRVAFWNVLNQYENYPEVVFRYTALPSKNDDIQWDKVYETYYQSILSPYAQEMFVEDKNGKIRNSLVSDIVALGKTESFVNKKLVDLGCGPGNLLPHIAGVVQQVYGIDRSKQALHIAGERGKEYGVKFIPINEDMRYLSIDEKFDYIVSVNSILPRNRADIGRILLSARKIITEAGYFYAILPSFDTVEYLMSLWGEHFNSVFGNNRVHADRCLKALKLRKKYNSVSMSYADDGSNIQCYHTPDTIRQDLHSAGFNLDELKEIWYPWSLCKQFDYGYFPSAPKEIWDWYVIARPK